MEDAVAGLEGDDIDDDHQDLNVPDTGQYTYPDLSLHSPSHYDRLQVTESSQTFPTFPNSNSNSKFFVPL